MQVGVELSVGSRGGEKRGYLGKRRKPGGCGGLSPTRPHLQLCLEASSLAQEWGHHVVSDRELVWNLCTAADQAWVDAIEVLVPKEAVLSPVFCHIL